MKRTVFIVGAGASTDFGLPLGSKLAEQISDIVRDEINSRCQGPLFDSVLRSGIPGEWGEAARDLSGGLVVARSIDRFLDSRRSDRLVIEFGKRGIAEAIARSERSSFIGNLPGEEWGQVHQALANSNGTWLAGLFGMLQEGCPPADCANVFGSCAFITFNYDRCIERYLQFAFRHTLNQSSDAADAHVDAIPIVHVYGSLGSLPSQGDEGIPFGPSPNRVDDAAASIRTFTEGALDGTLEEAHRLIAEAELLVFLGFGFDPLNVRALFPERLSKGLPITGTSMGLSPSALVAFRNVAFPDRSVQGMFADMDCKQFIRSEQFRRRIDS